MNYLLKTTLFLTMVILFSGCSDTKTPDSWEEDFHYQRISERPDLEVSYTDSSRKYFLVSADDYQLTGLMEKPHLLINELGEELLWFEMNDSEGNFYSTRNSEEPSRINLYRRGPYFSEIHWFDLELAEENGNAAPLRGDLTLYCYPEKVLAEIRWYSTGELEGAQLYIKGIQPQEYVLNSFTEDTIQSFSFPLFGEEPPLSESAFQTLVGEVPFKYDHRKGYYVVGTHTSGSFQKEFYETPNRYETATFTVTNDEKARKIYICHESAIGGQIVEGGMVLDEEGKPLPLVVQVSKNFPGEKEEPFYNPKDTAFSETFFPLYLDPNESATLTTLHLYQNWGKHMTKHWSSLGAWMDYFHSSTGVTETTCYVPFKFAGIGGVSIADMRAMSQETFWEGQPQHDNIAGHSFLTFFDGETWQHLKYVNTVYRSTGPNWYDIQINYISSDSSIRVSADIWETPQADELRSFFDVRYEVLKPLKISDAEANFRLLSITSAIQRLRYTRFACNGIPDMEIDFAQRPFPVKGVSLPSENAYVAEYGDHVRNRGSNAIVIRSFEGPGNIGPAATIQLGSYKERFSGDREADTRLLIVPDVEELELKEGDIFKINGYWLPYGESNNADTPREELSLYGNNLPEVSLQTGSLLSDFPLTIQAEKNVAEFTIRGGRDLVPVIITGLTDWRSPRVWQMENEKWRLLSHARNSNHDGYQVFCDEEGNYGAVFLVHSDQNEQRLKVTLEKNAPQVSKLEISTIENNGKELSPKPVQIRNEKIDIPVILDYPVLSDVHGKERAQPGAWKPSEGNSIWYHSLKNGVESGGRVTPNEEDLDLEFWWQFHEDGIVLEKPVFSLDLSGSDFEDLSGERTWGLTAEGWVKVKESDQDRFMAIAVQSKNNKQIASLVWENSVAYAPEGELAVAMDTPEFSQARRYFVRGKLYIIEGNMESLRLRILREMSNL